MCCLPVISASCPSLTSSKVSSRKKMMVVNLVLDMCALISSTEGSCSTTHCTSKIVRLWAY